MGGEENENQDNTLRIDVVEEDCVHQSTGDEEGIIESPRKKTKRNLSKRLRENVSILPLFVTSFFIFSCQNLISANMSEIAEQFGMTSEQQDLYFGGQIPFTFFVCGGVAAISMGPVIDSQPRISIFTMAALLVGIPCFSIFFCTNYVQLYIFNSCIGIGIGMAIPVVMSIVADLFPVEERNLANALLAVLLSFGMGVGQMMSGFLGASIGWNYPFLILSLPVLAGAATTAAVAREPPRGRYSEDPPVPEATAADCRAPFWAKYTLALSVPTNAIILIQAIIGCIPYGVSTTYMIDYLHEEKGLSVQGATLIFVAYGMGYMCAGLWGGACGQFLQNNVGGSSVAIFIGCVTFSAALPWFYILNGDLQSTVNKDVPSTAALILSFIGGIGGAPGPNLRAIIMNVNPARQQGTMFSLYTVTDDMGKGLGPSAIALFILKWGRRSVFNVAYSLMFISGSLQLCLALHYDRDQKILMLRESEYSASLPSHSSHHGNNYTQEILETASDEEREYILQED